MNFYFHFYFGNTIAGDYKLLMTITVTIFYGFYGFCWFGWFRDLVLYFEKKMNYISSSMIRGRM